MLGNNVASLLMVFTRLVCWQCVYPVWDQSSFPDSLCICCCSDCVRTVSSSPFRVELFLFSPFDLNKCQFLHRHARLSTKSHTVGWKRVNHGYPFRYSCNMCVSKCVCATHCSGFAKTNDGCQVWRQLVKAPAPQLLGVGSRGMKRQCSGDTQESSVTQHSPVRTFCFLLRRIAFLPRRSWRFLITHLI